MRCRGAEEQRPWWGQGPELGRKSIALNHVKVRCRWYSVSSEGLHRKILVDNDQIAKATNYKESKVFAFA